MPTRNDLAEIYIKAGLTPPARFVGDNTPTTQADIDNTQEYVSSGRAAATATKLADYAGSATPVAPVAPVAPLAPWQISELPPFNASPNRTAADANVPLWVKGKAGLEQAWVDEWIETGNDLLAREAVRAHADYETFFPGNQRDDGTVHITEGEYQSLIEGYENTLVSVGLNPAIFQELFPNLVAGDVDIGEFVDRVESVRVQVIDQVPAVMERMSTFYGIDYTEDAIFASFLDPTVGESILDRRIAVSQVGAIAWDKGFDVGISDVELVLNQGFGVAQARNFYAQAETMLPVLQALMARHDDPDDLFDLNDFTQALVLDDPEQRRKIRRTLAQERSSFVSGAGGPIAISQSGRRVGLEER